MDGERRMERPPLQVGREFAGCRLEAQVLIQVYELVVPVVRKPALDIASRRSGEAAAARTAWERGHERHGETQRQHVAQGA